MKISKEKGSENPECSKVQGYETLKRFALDIRWSWVHSANELWKRLDPNTWDLTRNPWVILQTISRERLEKELNDPAVQNLIQHIQELEENDANEETWFQKNHANSPLKSIAYFSMEYMLTEALPIYSGGLGNVAGDQLKAAHDLGVPVTAVGLLYQQGYFRQIIDKEGNQIALYPYNDPGQLPITPERQENGEWLRIEIPLPGYSIWLRVWQVKVGRVKLYLLDSNDPSNYPPHRGITSELYGGNADLRLQQELILGIGGWRLLRAIGLKPDICHLNEGHASFAILERAYDYMKEFNLPFAEALSITRVGNHFTTHTAVSAGFDRFSPDLINQYMKRYIENRLKISLRDLLALGRMNADDPQEYFNMAYLAFHGSGSVNGVSQLHCEVSKKIFEPLFPHWPESEIPISYVTNGVHMPSWDSEASAKFWTEICGKSRWSQDLNVLEQKIRSVPDEKLWEMRNICRKELIDFARDRITRQYLVNGESPENLEKIKDLFDPNILTLGFARRFATYKRPNMLLHDPERLLRILNNNERPVQLIIAGKAHPADIPGQMLIKEWNTFIKRIDARSRIIFLSDYDILLTQKLVQGIDVWINTPRRPWEACGTSGMKVLVNGGINVSELDGWWVEAFTPEVGWALGDGIDHGNDPANDVLEANALYAILENEIVPQFYLRNSEGIPNSWINRMRESMARLTPRYSAHRAVRQYTEEHYLPAALKYSIRIKNNEMYGKNLVKWKEKIIKNWPSLRFGLVNADSKIDKHTFETQVYLAELIPEDVRVELYAEKILEEKNVYELSFQRQLQGSTNLFLFSGTISSKRPIQDFTIRIVSNHINVLVPIEMAQILWQH